jgi:hypothetical protein
MASNKHAPKHAPKYRSAPDDDEAMAQIALMTKQINAVILVQTKVRAHLQRRKVKRAVTDKQQEGQLDRLMQVDAAVAIQAHVRGCVARGWPSSMLCREDSLDEGPDDASLFIVRNLDTGEFTTVKVDTTAAAKKQTAQLSFGTLQRGSSAWEAVRLECRGMLEKLAVRSTFSFKQYQLCIWQERWVFAEEDALCYQQLDVARMPTGKMKRIPYSSMQFVGPYDDTQFVLKVSRRTYTFLCPSAEVRTRWIKNICQLSGCSASTAVTMHSVGGKVDRRRSAKSTALGKARSSAAAPAASATSASSSSSSSSSAAAAADDESGGRSALPEPEEPTPKGKGGKAEAEAAPKGKGGKAEKGKGGKAEAEAEAAPEEANGKGGKSRKGDKAGKAEAEPSAPPPPPPPPRPEALAATAASIAASMALAMREDVAAKAEAAAMVQWPEKQSPPPESTPRHARTSHDNVQDNMAEMRRRKQVAHAALAKELAETREVLEALEERRAKALEASTWSLAEELQLQVDELKAMIAELEEDLSSH